MSDETDQSRTLDFSSEEALDWLENWYHVPVLAFLLVFMLWTRVQSWGSFRRGGQVFLSGNDAYYHLRNVIYTVTNWPATLPYDPWTGFAVGHSSGQFGTLFDQLIATGALLIGFGSPTQTEIELAVLFAPIVFAALAAIPTYFIGKRLGGRFAGVFGVLILALMPGLFLSRGVVGSADHNIAEPLFQSLAILGSMVALTVAERERPVWEQVVERDWVGLRRPASWSTLAGLVMALYMWLWPPGVLLVGIFGVFLILKLTGDYIRGVSPDHVAFVGAVSMSVTAILMGLPFAAVEFSPTSFSLLQPLFSLAVAVGAVFMAWLARIWDGRDLQPNLYPAAIGGIMVVGTGLLAVLAPSIYNMIRANLLRIVGFGTTASTRTISEAQPLLSRAGRFGISELAVVFLEYRMAFFTAVVALVWMLAKPLLTDDEHKAEHLLVIVWSLFLTSAAFTQVRFNYYLVVPVAVLNAFLVGEVISFVGLDRGKRAVENLEWSHAFVVGALLLLIVAPMAAAVDVGGPEGQPLPGERPAHQSAANTGPGGVQGWTGTLDWIQDNTPAEGNYGGAGNADQLDYYGTYAQTDDYDYPAGAYGVMSWWDYGHWITVEGERIPHANPFQQGATSAANYLLAPNASQAESVLSDIDEDDAKVRYTMVDWQMVSTQSKFGAPTRFYDAEEISPRDFYTPLYQVGENQVQRIGFNVRQQRYYESQMVRLYLYHGSAMEPQPIVTDWDVEQVRTQGGTAAVPTPPEEGRVIKQFRTMEAARQFMENDSQIQGEPTSQLGGAGRYPPERVSALEHYRLVKAADAARSFTAFRTAYPWVKTFERVPGATVEGTGPANATVTAAAEMRVPSTGSTFNYTQQAQTGPGGEFTMTLPYSTSEYEEWGTEEGYTNVSVRATGPYTFATRATIDQGNLTITRQSATADVPEGSVLGEDDEPIQVELTEEVVSELPDQPDGNETTTDGNDTATDGNQTITDGNETATDGNETTNTSASLANENWQPVARSD